MAPTSLAMPGPPDPVAAAASRSLEAETALLCLRSAVRAEAELRKAHWALLTGGATGGVLVAGEATLVTEGGLVPVELSPEPGSVLVAGEATLAWTAGHLAGSVELVVAASRPPGTEAGPVRLRPGRKWWLPLRRGAELLGALERLRALAPSARGALESLGAAAAAEAYPDRAAAARRAGALAARRLAAAYARPERPPLPFSVALAAELARELGPSGARVPLGGLLVHLSARRGWPVLPDAKVLIGLVLASTSARGLASLLARYDAGARLWSRPPHGMGRASAWLAAERARARCVLTWADAGRLVERWCATEGRPAPGLSRAEAEAVLAAADGQGFAEALGALSLGAEGPARGAQKPSTSQRPLRRTIVR